MVDMFGVGASDIPCWNWLRLIYFFWFDCWIVNIVLSMNKIIYKYSILASMIQYFIPSTSSCTSTYSRYLHLITIMQLHLGITSLSYHPSFLQTIVTHLTGAFISPFLPSPFISTPQPHLFHPSHPQHLDPTHQSQNTPLPHHTTIHDMSSKHTYPSNPPTTMVYAPQAPPVCISCITCIIPLHLIPLIKYSPFL